MNKYLSFSSSRHDNTWLDHRNTLLLLTLLPFSPPPPPPALNNITHIGHAAYKGKEEEEREERKAINYLRYVPHFPYSSVPGKKEGGGKNFFLFDCELQQDRLLFQLVGPLSRLLLFSSKNLVSCFYSDQTHIYFTHEIREKKWETVD